MKAFFRKPKDISYEDMEEYVKSSWNNSDDTKLFTFLYLLSRKYLEDDNIRVSAKQLDRFSIRCACVGYSKLSKENTSFRSIFNSIYYDILVEISLEDKDSEDSEEFLFQNHLTDLLQCCTFNGRSDITNFDAYINDFMKKIPRKRHSSEWRNIYISVLMSFLSTLNSAGSKIFDYTNQISPNVVLYFVDEIFHPYVYCLVSELINNLKDNFNSTISSRFDNVYSIRLKELLKNE